jgi:hypothetical protein
MSIDESREHGLSGEIDFSNAGCRETQDVGAFSNSEESIVCNGHCFRNWFRWIHGHDMAVMEDEVRLFLFEREERESSKRAEKFASSRPIDHRASLAWLKNEADATTRRLERQRHA